MSKREQQKNLRRRTILDAARALILEDQSRDFSMPALAEKAGVSLVTPYNLFGTKSNILLEIAREDIFERARDIDALACKNLVDWISDLSRTLARVYYSKRHYYRRMIITLTAQESGEVQRESLALTCGMYETALARIVEDKFLQPVIPVEVLARYIAHCVSGALQRRLMERVSEDRLRTDIELAVLLVLAGICADVERAPLVERIEALGRAAV